MEKKKIYLSAPLPFMGQKRMFMKEFRNVLKEFPDDAVYVDLFGGSGLLAHATKQEKPTARVVYNDFDNYRQRLENIGRTNMLLVELREMVRGCPRGKLLPKEVRERIVHRLEAEETAGFEDYITLSSSLLFSMKYVVSLDALRKESFYNNVKLSDYACDGYFLRLFHVKQVRYTRTLPMDWAEPLDRQPVRWCDPDRNAPDNELQLRLYRYYVIQERNSNPV